jgi:hypothetical protein
MGHQTRFKKSFSTPCVKENIVQVEPFEDFFLQLPQCKDLLDLVQKNSLMQATWSVLGGVPSNFEKLCEQLQEVDSALKKEECIKVFLCNEVGKSVRAVLKYETANPQWRDVLSRFRADGREYIRLDEVKDIQRASPDEVLREIEVGELYALAPASNSLKLALRHGFNKKPTFGELLSALKLPPAARVEPATHDQ